jgi:cell shape-determining protein MreD
VIRFSIATVLLLLAAFILQPFLPAFTGLYGSRILIVQVVFLCCAISTHQPMVLLLAFLAGLLWDAQFTLAPHAGDPEIYKQKVENLSFGYSILLFGAMGLLISGIQPLFHEGRWKLATLMIGCAIFVYLLAEFTLICFVRGDLSMRKETFLQVLFTSFLTMLLAPLVFWLLHSIAGAFGHSIQPHTNRRRRRSFAS